MARSPKKTKGRQKVEMVLMKNESNRQVTFSKRRCGLFKKASELCTLCDAKAAIIVFSPGRKLFSFGHPSVEAVISRFNCLNSSSSTSRVEQHSLTEVQRSASIYDLNMNLTILNTEIEKEKKRAEELNNIKMTKAYQQLWDTSIEELTHEQLIHFKASLEELKKTVVEHGNKLKKAEASNNNASQLPIMGVNCSMLGYYTNGAMFNSNSAMFNSNGEFIGYREDFY